MTFSRLPCAGWALATLVGACYSPDLTQGHYACRGDLDCPRGQLCTAGRCALTAPIEDLSRAADLAVSSADLARPADLAPPPPDQTGSPKPRTCVGDAPGFEVGPADRPESVIACVANFDGDKAAGACPGGYHLCSDKVMGDVDRLRAMNVVGCESLGGFFAADVLASFRAGNGNLVCLGASIPSPFALPGCGDEDNVRAATSECLSFHSGFPCDKDTPWKCNGQFRLSGASHKSAKNQGGVLCCVG